MQRGRGRRGVRPLRAVLSEFTSPPPTRSEFERDFLDRCREIGLPAPQLNVDVEGFEVDCFWPDLRLVVELDSRTHHELRAATDAVVGSVAHEPDDDPDEEADEPTREQVQDQVRTRGGGRRARRQGRS